MEAKTGLMTRLGIGVLDFLLLLAALVVFVLGIAVPLMGPAGIGWLDSSTCMPEICGKFPQVIAELVPGPWGRDLPPTNSTYDFGALTQVTVNAYDNWQHGPIALLLASQVLKGLVAFGVLVSMLLILRSLRDGDPFNRRNARIVFAEIFRRGAVMREDVEGLV